MCHQILLDLILDGKRSGTAVKQIRDIPFGPGVRVVESKTSKSVLGEIFQKYQPIFNLFDLICLLYSRSFENVAGFQVWMMSHIFIYVYVVVFL